MLWRLPSTFDTFNLSLIFIKPNFYSRSGSTFFRFFDAASWMIPYTAETTANVPASGYSTDGSMSAASLFGGAGGDGGASGGDGGCGGAGGAIVTRAPGDVQRQPRAR